MENKFILKIINGYINNKEDFFNYTDKNFPGLFKDY